MVLAPFALLTVGLESWDRAAAAARVIGREGLVVTAKQGGLGHAHPSLRTEKDARTTFARIWNDLGLNRDHAAPGGLQSWSPDEMERWGDD